MTRKIAVSLPDHTLARAKQVVVSGRAASVSGYIATLIDRAAAEESFQDMIARWNLEDSRTPEEIARGQAAAVADFHRAGLLGQADLDAVAKPKAERAKRRRR